MKPEQNEDVPDRVRTAERRDATRALISVAVRHQTIGRTSLAQAGDISAAGILLAQPMERLIPMPSKCWLEFSLPGSSTQIRARGEIVRQQQRGRHHLLAIRFRSIAPSHGRLIGRYVQGAPSCASTEAGDDPIDQQAARHQIAS